MLFQKAGLPGQIYIHKDYQGPLLIVSGIINNYISRINCHPGCIISKLPKNIYTKDVEVSILSGNWLN